MSRFSCPTSPPSTSPRSARNWNKTRSFRSAATSVSRKSYRRRKLRLRVWERGAGLTPACGTGACAALVAASRRGSRRAQAEILADGGALDIEWRADNHVVMTGPVAVSFTGMLDEALLA